MLANLGLLVSQNNERKQKFCQSDNSYPETSRVFVSELPPETQNVEEKSIRFFLDQSQSNGELEGTLVLCPGQIQS